MNRRFAAIAALLILAGCSDDPMGSTGDKLTRSEAMVIAASVESSGASAAAPQGNAAAAENQINAPPTTINLQQEASIPCPASGRIAAKLELSLVLDADARSVELDAEGNLAHNNCGFPHQGVTLTVNGDPDIDFAIHSAISGGQLSGSATSSAKGAFKWTASDGRSGRCIIDIETITNFATRKRTTEGQVCDFTINETVSWN
jgi:hypothetical protein